MPEDNIKQKVGNGVMFNISWLAIVGSESLPIAAGVVAAHLLIHQLWIGRGRRELAFIAGVALFGLLLDQALFAVGVFTLDGRMATAPLWLTCLWPVLATTLDHAFTGLQRMPVVAAILGGIGGYGSYLAGTAMSAVDFADPIYGPAIIGMLWAALFPILAVLARLWFHDQEGNGSEALA